MGRFFALCLVSLCLIPHETHAHSLLLSHPGLNVSHSLPRGFGVGGVIKVVAEVTPNNPQLELKVMQGDMGKDGGKGKGEEIAAEVLEVSSDPSKTRVSSQLFYGSHDLVGLAGFSKVQLLVEFQGEGIFVEVVGVGRTPLENTKPRSNRSREKVKSGRSAGETTGKEASGEEIPVKMPSSTLIPYSKHGWSGNINTAWKVLQSINLLYIGGSNVTIESVRAYVLV